MSTVTGGKKRCEKNKKRESTFLEILRLRPRVWPPPSWCGFGQVLSEPSLAGERSVRVHVCVSGRSVLRKSESARGGVSNLCLMD